MENQEKEMNRVIFLRKLTASMIYTIKRQESAKRNIQIEKLRQQFIERPLVARSLSESTDSIANQRMNKKEETLENLHEKHSLRPSVYSDPVEDIPRPTPKIKIQNIRQANKINFTKNHPILKTRRLISSFRQKHLPNQKESPKPSSNNQQINNTSINNPKIKNTPVNRPDLSIKPEPEKKPTDFNLEKIDSLINDPLVQQIECQGKGKNILVKRRGNTNITRIVLSEEDINKIIGKFSSEAKIPVVGGILKAAVGDMVISAVISENIGPKFIINKITPYSILD